MWFCDGFVGHGEKPDSDLFGPCIIDALFLLDACIKASNYNKAILSLS